jgi:hypothetical protein
LAGRLADYEAVKRKIGAKLAQLPAKPDRSAYEQPWQHLRSIADSIATAVPADLRGLLVLLG